MNRNTKFVLVLVASLYFWNYALTYKDWHFIDNVNLIFHEAGHAIFSFFGTFIHITAGSGFQILLPLFISLYFFYRKQKVSGSVCLFWVGTNFLNVSVYAADAIKMQLDLLGGDSVIHDWNYILSALGILRYADTEGSVFYILGLVTIFAGTVLALNYAWNGEGELSKKTLN